MMTGKLRALVLLAALSFLGPIVEMAVSGRIDQFGKAALIQGVLSAAIVYWWYHLDKVERSFRAGMIQNVGVLVLSLVALPVYFVRSRGWTRGGQAIFAALGVLLAAAALTYAGELVALAM